MGMIYFRGAEMAVPNDIPIDLHIPEWGVIIQDTILGERATIWAHVNLYGAILGEGVKISNFIEIRNGVRVGRFSKLEPFVFIPEGVTLGEGVFVGPNVAFTNDLYPRAFHDDGSQVTDYNIAETVVEDFASIGAGSVIRCGVRIGKKAMVGAGSVVTRDIGPGELWYGDKAVKRGDAPWISR